jgi:ribonuclease BN (tRNA processing enzyme)
MRRPSLFIALALTLAAAPATAQDGVWVTLGTMGGPVADGSRSQPANLLLHGDDAYLVDVGDGTVQQLANAKVALPRVKAVFLSHLHVDHTGGLAALLGLRNQTDVRGVLTVYGPPGTRELVAGIVASMQPAAAAGYGMPGKPWAAPQSTVTAIELADGADLSIAGIRVRAAQNTHYDFAPGSAADKRFKSFAYRFDTGTRAIVYTGDTGPSAAVEKLAAGADLLVSEMIDLETTLASIARAAPGMPEAARGQLSQHLSAHHLTPREVGLLAARARVKAVVVTHFAGGTPDAARTAGYRSAIGAAFAGPVTLAADLDRF